jgi:hypothetical protein
VANSGYEFEIAFSFASEDTFARVREIAKLLSNELGPEKVFFSEWFENDIAGINSHKRLSEIYETKSRLIVGCFSKNYNGTTWTKIEWNAIQKLSQQLPLEQRLRLMMLRFGGGVIQGVRETDIVLDVQYETPRAIADRILERLYQLAPEKQPNNRLVFILCLGAIVATTACAIAIIWKLLANVPV